MNIIIGVLNKLLPIGKKLLDNASEEDIREAAETVEAHQTTREMLKTEGKSTHSTRPRIALGAFYIIAFASIITVSMWAVAVIRNQPEMVDSIVSGWPFVAAILAPFVVLLRQYFGVLRDEQSDRLDAISGVKKSRGLFNKIFNKGGD